jgi:hypothetical protein
MTSLDPRSSLRTFAEQSRYSYSAVLNTAYFLAANGVPEDQVLPLIQTLDASDMAGVHCLEYMAECLVDVLSGEHSLC